MENAIKLRRGDKIISIEVPARGKKKVGKAEAGTGTEAEDGG
jgi:hypothetical protein